MSSIEHNPLKQYFRRPGIYLKLPTQGKGYGPDVLVMTETGELPVYPMTAIDEITSKTPDALYNGSAVAEIIRSCVPSIKDPWAISSVDLDAILVAIKIATNGNDMDLDTTCPNCNEDSKFGLNLSFVLNNFAPGDYDRPLMIDNLRIKFRPLMYKELTNSTARQLEIQRAFITLNSMEEGPEREARSTEILKIIGDSTIDVLVNGKCRVELPDYMYKLILHDSINIQLTGIKCNKTLYVDDINIPENYFTIAYDKAIFESYKDYDFFWDFTAIRADVPELITEL